MAKILIAEDDLSLQRLLVDHLKAENHTAEAVADGQSALELLELYPFDLIVLDVTMPVMTGFEVCRRFRAAGGQSKVLMLTGKDSIEDKETGLDLGADDYLTKPFHPQELMARVRALLRRAVTLESGEITLGNLSINPKKYLVFKLGQQIKLTPKEFALLEFFMRHPNTAFDGETLVERLWQSEREGAANSLKTYIHRLRERLGSDAGTPQIVTVPGEGYVLRF